MIIEKPPEQLTKEDLYRQGLEAAAQRLETLGGNELYRRAWRRAAEEIRRMAQKINFNSV